MVYRYGKKVWYSDRLFSATAEESDTIVSIGDTPLSLLWERWWQEDSQRNLSRKSKAKQDIVVVIRVYVNCIMYERVTDISPKTGQKSTCVLKN